MYVFIDVKMYVLYTLGAFFNFKVDIVGHIDNFAADWKSKIVPQYNLPERYQYTDGNYMDKPDPEYLQKRSSVNLTHGLLFHREVRYYTIISYISSNPNLNFILFAIILLVFSFSLVLLLVHYGLH